MTVGSYRIQPGRQAENVDDAVDCLTAKSPDWATWGYATIRIGSIDLPDFRSLDLAVLAGPKDDAGNGWAIGMASAMTFTARLAIMDERQTYPIHRLNGAVVDEYANVTLADEEETRLFDVRLKPSPAPSELTAGELEALRQVLRRIDADMVFIAYGYLPKLNVPPLKVLKEFSQTLSQGQSSKLCSIELFRTTLLKCGMRDRRYTYG